MYLFFFFFNDTATTEIYTLSLHDALPICSGADRARAVSSTRAGRSNPASTSPSWLRRRALTSTLLRSEEHTSELQSQSNLVCRLLLEKKNIRAQASTDSQHAALSHLSTTL